MSVAAISWARAQTTGSPARKAVLLIIADFADMDGCWRVSVERLAVETEFPPSEVTVALRELEELGFVRGVGAGVVQLPLPPEPARTLRERVLERDGHACRYCGVTGIALECDHVLPRSRGGPTTLENLVASCKSCNASKGARTPEEWRARSS